MFSITKFGEPLDPSLYTINDEVFFTRESNLVVDFYYENSWTFITGHKCTFVTGSDCKFITGSDCTFTTDHECTFVTGANCTFNTKCSCTFVTSGNCIFRTGANCVFQNISGFSKPECTHNHFSTYINGNKVPFDSFQLAYTLIDKCDVCGMCRKREENGENLPWVHMSKRALYVPWKDDINPEQLGLIFSENP